jgi:hypothetical protein
MPREVKILSYTELLARKEKIKENGRLRAAAYRAKNPEKVKLAKEKYNETLTMAMIIIRRQLAWPGALLHYNSHY